MIEAPPRSSVPVSATDVPHIRNCLSRPPRVTVVRPAAPRSSSRAGGRCAPRGGLGRGGGAASARLGTRKRSGRRVTKGRRTIVMPRHDTLRHARKKELPSERFESGRRSDDAGDGEWHHDRNHDTCSDATDAAASKRERFHRVGAVVWIENAARGEIRTGDGTSSLELGLANASYLRCQRTTRIERQGGCIS